MGFISDIFGYVLNFLYNLMNNYGLAIIILSILLRLILIPITIKQQKSMKKSAKMQEKMKEIQFKYKNNPEKLNQATMELYKEEKFNPFSGCLSGVLQIVIILSVFWLVSQPLTYMVKVNNNEELKAIYEEYVEKVKNEEKTTNYTEIKIISEIEEDYKKIVEQINNYDNNEVAQVNNEQTENVEQVENTEVQEEKVLTKEELEAKKLNYEKLRINMNFLGLDLNKVPTENLNDWRVYIIPALYIVTSFISIKLTTKLQNTNNKKKDVVIDENGNTKEISKEDEMMDSMNQMTNTMSWMVPIMSISVASIAPLGLALYWLVSNILMILERVFINKFVKSGEEDDNNE